MVVYVMALTKAARWLVRLYSDLLVHTYLRLARGFARPGSANLVGIDTVILTKAACIFDHFVICDRQFNTMGILPK